MENSLDKNINILSSFIFLTNSFVAYFFDYKLYSLLFLCLWITSILYHTNKNIYTNILDKFIIFTIFIYGGYLFVTKTQNIKYKILIILSFLSTIFLYTYTSIYEYSSPSSSFSSNTNTKNTNAQLHSLLHLIASIGHHLLVII